MATLTQITAPQNNDVTVGLTVFEEDDDGSVRDPDKLGQRPQPPPFVERRSLQARARSPGGSRPSIQQPVGTVATRPPRRPACLGRSSSVVGTAAIAELRGAALRVSGREA